MKFVPEKSRPRYSFDRNGNLLRNDRLVEGEVFGVPEHKLKCVLARSQFNVRLSLAGAEMKMSLVLWDRLVRIERFVHVNQQMVVATIGSITTRLGDPHIAKTETTPERPFESRTIWRPDNVKESVGGCWCCLRVCRNWHSSQHDRQ